VALKQVSRYCIMILAARESNILFLFYIFLSNVRKYINEKVYGHRMQNIAHIYNFIKQWILQLECIVIISVKTSK
jgi:hypothetical protein